MRTETANKSLPRKHGRSAKSNLAKDHNDCSLGSAVQGSATAQKRAPHADAFLSISEASSSFTDCTSLYAPS